MTCSSVSANIVEARGWPVTDRFINLVRDKLHYINHLVSSFHKQRYNTPEMQCNTGLLFVISMVQLFIDFTYQTVDVLHYRKPWSAWSCSTSWSIHSFD